MALKVVRGHRMETGNGARCGVCSACGASVRYTPASAEVLSANGSPRSRCGRPAGERQRHRLERVVVRLKHAR